MGPGWLDYRDVFCDLFINHMPNFNSVDRDNMQETQTKWWNMNLYRSRLSKLCGLS